MKPELIPAILVKNKKKLVEKLKKASRYFYTAQIDIMDGKFVKNKTVQASAFSGIKTKLKYEIQLMVKNPISFIDDFKKIKAKTIIFHIEACKNRKGVLDVIKAIKMKKMKFGIGINPATSAEKIKPFLGKIDLVLVMTVKPGKGGQKFIPSMLKKVSQIRKWNKKINIEVDGGINAGNIGKCVEAGANHLVVGSSIFGKKNIHRAIKDLKTKL